MMSIFKPRYKQKQHKINVRQEMMAASIVHKITFLQQRWALSMQRFTERLSNTEKKIALIAFCLLSGSYSIYVMAGRSENKQEKLLSITTLQLSEHSRGDYLEITADEYVKMKQIIHYLDSLSRNQQGKKVANSISISRLDLKDSVASIEKLYQLQSSKK